ncbi:rhodanese-like domain-containing protein [Aeromicrobium sp. UC242_57]|uniref:rhodanese-like domain-containing protein n=1 Tax=Aeromicrobium sp. UC242_57 TaxID=3374624 RepID=UPI0037BB61F1
MTDATPVLDVREPHEWAAGRIEGAIHIPLGERPARLAELDPQKPTLVICHLGGVRRGPRSGFQRPGIRRHERCRWHGGLGRGWPADRALTGHRTRAISQRTRNSATGPRPGGAAV